LIDWDKNQVVSHVYDQHGNIKISSDPIPLKRQGEGRQRKDVVELEEWDCEAIRGSDWSLVEKVRFWTGLFIIFSPFVFVTILLISFAILALVAFLWFGLVSHIVYWWWWRKEKRRREEVEGRYDEWKSNEKEETSSNNNHHHKQD